MPGVRRRRRARDRLRRRAGAAPIALVARAARRSRRSRSSLALVELAGDAEQVSEQPPGATPTLHRARGRDHAAPATHAARSTTIPPATDDGSAGATPEIADCRTGRTPGPSCSSPRPPRPPREARAKELASQGVPVGILNSDGYQLDRARPLRRVLRPVRQQARRRPGASDVSGQVTGGCRPPHHPEGLARRHVTAPESGPPRRQPRRGRAPADAARRPPPRARLAASTGISAAIEPASAPRS